VSKRFYFWQQAQLCMSLARVCNDPILKERYEDMALDFAQNAGREHDLEGIDSSLFGLKPPEPSMDGNQHN
jgi:hypothetical protein